MSRRDAMRQRHRAASPRAASETVQGIPVEPDSKRTDVPQPSAENFAARVRETLMVMLGRQGDPLDRGITLRDLIDSGVVTLNPGYSLGAGGGSIPISPGGGASSNVKPDLTPPPQVTNFRASPSLTSVFFETDNPTWAMGHGYFVTNIYGAQPTQAKPNPTFSDAIQVFSFTGSVGAWATRPNTTWYFWAKWETRDGVESINPAGGTNGVSATTGQDVDKLVSAMTGPGEPFMVVPVGYTLPDGTYVPAGTYTADAYIRNGSLVNAKIVDATIESAKIVSLAVGKLNAGSITAAFIQSPQWNNYDQGWRVQGDGWAQFGNISVRGNVYATSGVFSGIVYASDGIFAGDISAARGRFRGGVMGGAYSGYGWPPSGTTGYFLGPVNTNDPNSGGGLLLGNAYDNRYFQVEYNGDVHAPNFSIIGGQVNINGTITMTSQTGNSILVINSQRIEVYEVVGPGDNRLRVRMGIW